MAFEKFIEWAFMAVLSGGVVWSTRFLSKISKSISILNIQIAGIVERSEWLKKGIEDLDDRVTRVEDRL